MKLYSSTSFGNKDTGCGPGPGCWPIKNRAVKETGLYPKWFIDRGA